MRAYKQMKTLLSTWLWPRRIHTQSDRTLTRLRTGTNTRIRTGVRCKIYRELCGKQHSLLSVKANILPHGRNTALRHAPSTYHLRRLISPLKRLRTALSNHTVWRKTVIIRLNRNRLKPYFGIASTRLVDTPETHLDHVSVTGITDIRHIYTDKWYCDTILLTFSIESAHPPKKSKF